MYRTTLLCCSLVIVLRVVSVFSKVSGQLMNTTSEPPKQATCRPGAYWQPLMVQTGWGSLCAPVINGTWVISCEWLIVWVILFSSRRCCAAFHPFSSKFLCSWPSTPAAALFSLPSLHNNLSYPASLLEHREPVSVPVAVIHASSPPSSQHWGRNLPVDCRARIDALSQKNSYAETIIFKTLIKTRFAWADWNNSFDFSQECTIFKWNWHNLNLSHNQNVFSSEESLCVHVNSGFKCG